MTAIDPKTFMALAMHPFLASTVAGTIDAQDAAMSATMAVDYAARDVAQRDTLVIQSAAIATGNSLATALALTGDVVHIKSTSASDADCAKLRVAAATTLHQVVINRGSNPLKVYPPTAGGKIDGQASGVPVTLSAGQSAHFCCVNTTNGEEYFRMP